LKPNFAPAHDTLGDVLLKKGDQAAALKEYQEALRLSPRDHDYKAKTERLGEKLAK
jgi:predicted negative regulator of RcsB-dependent stress response